MGNSGLSDPVPVRYTCVQDDTYSRNPVNNPLHMQRAFELARRAAGLVSPRPPVGAVIVRDGRVVGEGRTQPRPGLHAEVAAIQAAGAASRGATMYVSLEPHAHHGIALPCTDAIIAAGIKQVVCPIEDSNPMVSGNGFRQLRASGVEVEVGGTPEELRAAVELTEGFTKWVTMHRPFVTAKFAMSLDGRIATRTGDSKWITGDDARRAAHEMRAMSDAVMAGIGTVLQDDPRLTARVTPLPRTLLEHEGETEAATRPRLRVIVDTEGRMPPTAALLREPGHVLWVRGATSILPPLPPTAHSASSTIPGQIENAGADVEIIQLPRHADGVDLDALLVLLGQRGVCTVMVEGGGTLLGALFDRGLVDKVAGFIAPVIVGGRDAPGPVGGRGVEKITDALRLERVSYRQVGDDMLVSGYVKW